MAIASNIIESLQSLAVNIADLTVDEKNTRKHNKRNIDAIAKSLKRFGQRKPLVVQKQGMVIRAGNGTAEAAKLLDWDQIAAVVIDDENSEAKAFAIADNRTGDLSTWDEKELMESLEEFERDGYLERDELLNELSFSDEELEAIMNPKYFQTSVKLISELKPHPRNYREHTEDQLAHIIASINEHGFYRNVVISEDGFILAGHGVVEAASKIGFKGIPVIQLAIKHDDPHALKLLTADNEIANTASIDDRILTEILKELKDDLLGSGYDSQQLANLVMVTRPANEIADFDAANEWVGMPDHDAGTKQYLLSVKFQSKEDMEKFLELIGEDNPREYSGKSVIWWPKRDRDDLSSLKFEETSDVSSS